MRAPVVALLLLAEAAAAASPLWDGVAGPGPESARRLLDDGRRLLGERKVGPAIAALEEATRAAPDEAEPFVALGEAKRAAGDTAGARAALERARALVPDDGDGRLALDLGALRAEGGDFAGALVELRRAEASASAATAEADLASRLLGDAYLALGRVGEAIATYRRALARNERSARARFALAVALDRDEQLAASDAELRLALARDRDLRALAEPLDPTDAPFLPPADRRYYLAVAELARGHLAAARAHLRGFLAAAPRSPWAARARDRLADVPEAVDPRELAGGGFDHAALAKALGPTRAAAERCLRSGAGELVLVGLDGAGARGMGLSAEESACLGRATVALRRLVERGVATWPVARPSAPP